MFDFQGFLIPLFGLVVLIIVVLGTLLWLIRTTMVLVTGEYKLRASETLGLPKGTIRSFIVITFTAIMFLIFFGDIGIAIPADDRKWFLTAYAGVISFYFGTKYFPQGLGRTGLSISSVTPEVAKPGSENVSLIIMGSGFNNLSEVAVSKDGTRIVADSVGRDSDETIEALFNIPEDAQKGGYNITVELTNGSRIVRESAFLIE